MWQEEACTKIKLKTEKNAEGRESRVKEHENQLLDYASGETALVSTTAQCYLFVSYHIRVSIA